MLLGKKLTVSGQVWQRGYTFHDPELFFCGEIWDYYPIGRESELVRPLPGSGIMLPSCLLNARRNRAMRASVDGQIVAESSDVIEVRGYHYFPASAVRRDWLQKTGKKKSTQPFQTSGQ